MPIVSIVANWLARTPNRTFVLYPLLTLVFEVIWHRGVPMVSWWGLPLLTWGYLQYRLVGSHRSRRGGGGPGPAVPPERILQHGPYRYTRNPMYLGHLIFMLGLAVALQSWFALALLAGNAVWFHRRVREDEAQLAARFGREYLDYTARVKRWIPGLL